MIDRYDQMVPAIPRLQMMIKEVEALVKQWCDPNPVLRNGARWFGDRDFMGFAYARMPSVLSPEEKAAIAAAAWPLCQEIDRLEIEQGVTEWGAWVKGGKKVVVQHENGHTEEISMPIMGGMLSGGRGGP